MHNKANMSYIGSRDKTTHLKIEIQFASICVPTLKITQITKILGQTTSWPIISNTNQYLIFLDFFLIFLHFLYFFSIFHSYKFFQNST